MHQKGIINKNIYGTFRRAENKKISLEYYQKMKQELDL